MTRAIYRTRWTLAEDNTLRKYAGRKCAEDIAALLGRTPAGVHHRVKALGLTGHIRGEHHWNAKVSDLIAAMVGVLHDAGFQPKEIQTLLNQQHDLSTESIGDICAGRTRRGAPC